MRGNRIERTGSDGIIVANCISPLIDSNVCFDAGALGTLEDTQLIAGIWVCATRDALIQRNEVARTECLKMMELRLIQTGELQARQFFSITIRMIMKGDFGWTA